MVKRSLLTVLVAAVVMSCSAETASPPVGSSSAPIVDGVRSTNTSVVFLYNLSGAACTATIVAPRAVLTAKHCIQGSGSSAAPASQFRVYVGSSTSSLTAEYRVASVHPAPGCWNLCGDASDVAMLILASPAREEPIPISFGSPGSLTGQPFTAVGYGQTPSGGSGTRYQTEKTVDGVSRNIIYVEPSVCSGDSGGPLIGPDGSIYGVASFIYSPDGGSRPQCGTAPGAYNGISHLQSFIEGVIEESGTCIAGGEEVCNGEDDDCDGEVDETCTPLGEPCTADDECIGQKCSETSAGRICTQDCDALRPELGCPPGMYCDATGGCDGLCVPGEVAEGGLGYDADCTADTDCASLFCIDPGDGRQRCLDPCRGDSGMCLSGEACAATPGACGGCVAAGIVVGSRGLGEPCETPEDCGSGLCFMDEGLSYCSRECTGDEACGEGFHCRSGTCARGPRGGIGSGCVENADCGEGALCAHSGDRSWCTSFCGECPDGFECVAAGDSMVCSPSAGLVGEACEVNEDCVSNLCIDSLAGRVCTRLCGPDNHCDPGLECVRTSDGLRAVCSPPPPPPADGGGCSVGSESRPAHLGWLVLSAGVLAVFARRRRRR